MGRTEDITREAEQSTATTTQWVILQWATAVLPQVIRHMRGGRSISVRLSPSSAFTSPAELKATVTNLFAYYVARLGAIMRIVYR